MIEIYVMIIIWGVNVSGNEFEAYDCQQPQNSHFFTHDDCRIHDSGHLEEEDMLIYQDNVRFNVTGEIVINLIMDLVDVIRL